MNDFKLFELMVCSLLIFSCSSHHQNMNKQNQPEAVTADGKVSDHRPGEILVRFEKGTTSDEIKAIQDRLHLKLIRQFAISNLFLMKIVDGTPTLEIIENLNAFEKVLYAEPNYMIRLIEPKMQSPYIPDEILVRFRADTDEKSIRVIQEELHLQTIQTFPLPKLYLMKILSNSTVKKTMEKLFGYEQVLYAEPNYVHQLNRQKESK